MNMSVEKYLCAAYVAIACGLFADCFARGTESLYGRFFMWVCTFG